MAFNSIIRNQVNAAFNRLGDLAKDVTLVRAGAEVYDPTTGRVTVGDGTEIVVKGIVGEARLSTEDSPSLISEITVKTEDVGMVDRYDGVIVDSVVWNITGMEYNDYTTSVQITRSL